MSRINPLLRAAITLRSVNGAPSEADALRYGLGDTPFGPAVVVAQADAICGLHFVSPDLPDPQALVPTEWPAAQAERDDAWAAELLRNVFAPGGPAQPVEVAARGTPFQLRVWEALLHVPLGSTTTYQSIADALSMPGGARAVGAAVGANKVAYLVPCHRVLRADGRLGDFRWGLVCKAALLDWEFAHAAQP